MGCDIVTNSSLFTMLIQIWLVASQARNAG
jgi:hypothetical protein